MNKRQRLDKIEARAKAIADSQAARPVPTMTRCQRRRLFVEAIMQPSHEEFLKVWRLLQAEAGNRPAAEPPGQSDGL